MADDDIEDMNESPKKRRIMLPRAVAVTLVEGGEWIPLELWQKENLNKRDPQRLNPFAIKFSNGWIWDPIATWREDKNRG